MAYFSRLIFLGLLFISGSAFACPQGYICKPAIFKVSGTNSAGQPGPSAQGCGAIAAAWVGWANNSSIRFQVLSSSESPATCNFETSQSYFDSSRNTWSAFSGSSGRSAGVDCGGDGWSTHWDSASSTNLCKKIEPICPTGQTVNPQTGNCEESCPEAGHTEGGSGDVFETTSRYPDNDVCLAGCKWTAGGTVPSVCANGKCYYWGPMVSNGASCSGTGGGDPGGPEPAPPDDAQCVGKGLCPGTINGTKVCVPCSSKEGTTSESGSSSGTDTDSSGNPTGGTGTTNTTKETTANCTNGSCNTTTTTTVTHPDGSTTTTTETESAPQVDFCKNNPGHIVCKGQDEGTFGGTCAAGFQCSGDAVQCAQAEAAWKSVCALDVSGMTDQVNDGTAAMAAGAASGLDIPGGSEVFDLGSRLSEVPLFGSSGGCPSDVSVNVGGTSYTIAFSSMCPQLQVLGVALMAFAYLVAGFIVFRGDRS